MYIKYIQKNGVVDFQSNGRWTKKSAKTAVFDAKTGTLTEGELSVVWQMLSEMKREVLSLVASLEDTFNTR